MLKCPHCGKSIPEKVVAAHIRERARKTGKLGGEKTSERGPDYYRNIQAQRKTRAGGRPPKPKPKKGA